MLFVSHISTQILISIIVSKYVETTYCNVSCTIEVICDVIKHAAGAILSSKPIKFKSQENQLSHYQSYIRDWPA